MASTPARGMRQDVLEPSAREAEEPVRTEARSEEHKAKVRASLQWALVEFDGTLAKLAK